MQSTRFDSWTRSRAERTNRRAALSLSAMTALGAALTRILPSGAQFSGGSGSCTYDVSLTSSLGVTGSVLGTLVIDIGDDGAIDTGSLTLQGQAVASVVGQVFGQEIALSASLADGTVLSLVGITAANVAACSQPITGSLANADNGQLGTWQAQPNSSAPMATSTPTRVPVSDGNTNQPPPAPTPTPTPSQPVGACDPPKMICGQSCCPAGADCLDNGTCQCPTGTEECGIACIPSCVDGHALDPATCICPTA